MFPSISKEKKRQGGIVIHAIPLIRDKSDDTSSAHAQKDSLSACGEGAR